MVRPGNRIRDYITNRQTNDVFIYSTNSFRNLCMRQLFCKFFLIIEKKDKKLNSKRFDSLNLYYTPFSKMSTIQLIYYKSPLKLNSLAKVSKIH